MEGQSQSPAKGYEKQLAALAEAVNDAHQEATSGQGPSLRHALRAGESLLCARELVCPGTWTAWVRRNVSCDYASARTYMRLAYYRSRLSDIDAPVTVDGACELLRGLPSVPSRELQERRRRVRAREQRAAEHREARRQEREYAANQAGGSLAEAYALLRGAADALDRTLAVRPDGDSLLDAVAAVGAADDAIAHYLGLR